MASAESESPLVTVGHPFVLTSFSMHPCSPAVEGLSQPARQQLVESRQRHRQSHRRDCRQVGDRGEALSALCNAASCSSGIEGTGRGRRDSLLGPRDRDLRRRDGIIGRRDRILFWDPKSHVRRMIYYLHFRLAERTTYHGTRRAGVSFDYLHARTQMCSDSWYTRVAVCGSKRKMVQGR